MREKNGFSSHSCHKTAAVIGDTVEPENGVLLLFVLYHMRICESRLHHVCQGGYVAMHGIDIDRVELNIFPDCVDKICIGGKPEKLKRVQHRNVYRTDK